jgi:peptidoglycan/LPS O-acetylase OafA/YrhL
VLYRAERGELSWPWAVAVTTVVGVVLAFVMALPLYRWVSGPRSEARWSWLTATLLAVVVFGLGLRWRAARVPGWAATLGRISYSIYLLHTVLILVMLAVVGNPSRLGVLAQIGLGVAVVVAVIGLSLLTYRFIEDPFQRWGHALARRLDTRFGSDAGGARLLPAFRTADSHAAP